MLVDTIPVPGLYLLLGNVIAGRIEVTTVIVSGKPLSFHPIQMMMEKPCLFPSSVMTRSKTK